MPVLEQNQAEALLAGERRLLEMVASGCPLPEVLDALCRLVEGFAGGCHCSVLLVDPGDSHLQHGAAPSLPPLLCRAIDGRPVFPYWGPCAMAVHERIQVIVSDAAADPRWETGEWCRLMIDLGLRSCWSTPIVTLSGTVLGTFALYQPEPGSPTPLQQDLIGQLTHLASIAIELSQARTELAQRAYEAGDVDGLRERYASLTRREREVMAWVVSGLLNKQIGAELGTSEVTVKAHRGRVMRKMQADSLADLVRMAARLDLPILQRQ